MSHHARRRNKQPSRIDPCWSLGRAAPGIGLAAMASVPAGAAIPPADRRGSRAPRPRHRRVRVAASSSARRDAMAGDRFDARPKTLTTMARSRRQTLAGLALGALALLSGA